MLGVRLQLQSIEFERRVKWIVPKDESAKEQI